jgi:hypothetical protein
MRQLQPKWRVYPRPAGGALRVRQAFSYCPLRQLLPPVQQSFFCIKSTTAFVPQHHTNHTLFRTPLTSLRPPYRLSAFNSTQIANFPRQWTTATCWPCLPAARHISRYREHTTHNRHDGSTSCTRRQKRSSRTCSHSTRQNESRPRW